MTRLILIATVFMLVSGPVGAEDVLFCSDQDANGIKFKNGHGNRTGYKIMRFVVKIISPTHTNAH